MVDAIYVLCLEEAPRFFFLPGTDLKDWPRCSGTRDIMTQGVGFAHADIANLGSPANNACARMVRGNR